jgi:hypothetical protein
LRGEPNDFPELFFAFSPRTVTYLYSRDINRAKEMTLKHEWRKEDKALYLPKTQPELITIPAQKFF